MHVMSLFNHCTLGVCSFFLYQVYSLSRLCCCYCIMVGNTHTRIQRPATHSKKVVRQCATSNRQMSSISGPAWWWSCFAYSSWVCCVCCICVWISKCLVLTCTLFNYSKIGVWSFYLYQGSSLSWLCCCYCIMAWNTHGRNQRPATHSKRAVLKCATSNRQMSVISGRATTRCGS